MVVKKLTVYVDLLLCYNLLVHFCLIGSTAAVCNVKVKKGRILLASLLGSLYSFAIFLTLNVVEFMLLKAVMAATLLLAAFGFVSIGVFLKRMTVFLAVNTVYAGVMMGVAFSVAPKGMVYKSGVAYFGGNIGVYAGGLLAGYLLLKAFVWLWSRKRGEDRYYPVTVICGERRVDITAFYDSGNRMADLYTGKPVMILSPSAAKQLMPEEIYADIAAGELSQAVVDFGHKARLMPLDTVAASGMAVTFVPDGIIVNGKEKYDWSIAVAKTELRCNAAALLPASF